MLYFVYESVRSMEQRPREMQADKYYTIVDFQGKRIRLYEHTVSHIKMRHPEIKDPREFVKKILENPILLTEDELPDTVVYH